MGIDATLSTKTCSGDQTCECHDPRRSRKEWAAQVFRTGRTPSDYEPASEGLHDMFAIIGATLDEANWGRVEVSSVQTQGGAGIEPSPKSWANNSPPPGSGDQDG